METESSLSTNSHPRVCATCNQQEGIVYQMRLHNRDGTHTTVELPLCEQCFDVHHAFEWIEVSGTVTSAETD